MSRQLMIIAGEISGDMHAARVVEQLKAAEPGLSIWGIGGDELRALDVELLHDTREMAVLGLWEVLKRYGFFRRVFGEMVEELERRKPDAVLLVDYPGFNLRFAKEAHRRGVKVLYYICPQVWAWHRSRIHKMARIVDRLMVIFPFEVAVFAGTPVRVDFVGHPLVNAARHALSAPSENLPWQDADRVHRIALLPGSRKQEVERILPAMLAAASRVERDRPASHFIVAAPSPRIAELVDQQIRVSSDRPARVDVVIGRTREVLRQARAAMVASGTATIETALMGCPMIVVYKTAALTYWFGKRLIQVPHLGMVNIVAGRLLCPEFIQHEADPDAMARAVAVLLDDTDERSAMIKGLQEVTQALGETDSAERAAGIIFEELQPPT